MKPRPPYSTDDDPDAAGEAPGPYDGESAEDGLWFLPGPDPEGEADPFAPPLPQAPRQALFDLGEWRAAEAALAQPLADLALDLGRLVERVETMGQGAAERLAQEEAAALSWWTGDRIAPDRIALWLAWRIGAAGEDGEALIRTAWAARRLAGPGTTGIAATVGDLLDDAGRGDAGFVADVVGALEGVAGLAPVTRGCAAFQLWCGLEERPDHLRSLEAAVLGARLAGQGGLGFLPLTLTGFGALTASGDPERRLAAWLQGAHRAVLAALMALHRLAEWRGKAEAGIADLSGSTPARLVTALAAHPMLGAAQAERETGASRAAVQRNLDLLSARGLVREVTGQGRFRVWAAKV